MALLSAAWRFSCCLPAASAGVQEVKFLSKEQETESKHFKDPATNIDLEVTDKVREGQDAGFFAG